MVLAGWQIHFDYEMNRECVYSYVFLYLLFSANSLGYNLQYKYIPI